ncbi:unnamed protein product [Boreogadus saida]
MERVLEASRQEAAQLLASLQRRANRTWTPMPPPSGGRSASGPWSPCQQEVLQPLCAVGNWTMVSLSLYYIYLESPQHGRPDPGPVARLRAVASAAGRESAALSSRLPQVVLPTFILEKRSLLEMYADFMSHPDLFLAVADGASPEDRMVRFVEYYLTSFHEGRRGAVAKKPYNPIIGETFQCSWRVPRRPDTPPEPASTAPGPASMAPPPPPPGSTHQVRFVAEQVSHHPPVSGFYAECPEKRVCVNTHVWTKSKFMGMSIGVSMVGEGCLSLLDHEEDYTFTLPCAYARSILTVPWVELGGKVIVTCAKSGYSAVITFHTKPFYGGKLHKVTAEVKHSSTGAVACRVQGEWNGVLEFSYPAAEGPGAVRLVDVTKLPVCRKHVRPVGRQGATESR